MTPPRIDREPVVLPLLGGPLDAVWETLIELGQRLEDLPWTLVGGQMVVIHGMEHGMTTPRVSSDLDAAVNVRAAPRGLPKMIRVLANMGFAPAGTSPEGLTHRFVKAVGADGPGHNRRRRQFADANGSWILHSALTGLA